MSRASQFIRLGLSFAALVLVLAACGDDSGESTESDGSADQTEASDEASGGDESDADSSSEEASDDAAETDDGSAAPAGGGGGTATIALENGETFEATGALCNLEPQEAAGSEILFTAVAYDNPQFDVTQFGSGGIVNDNASVSVFATEDYLTYEYYWESNSDFGELTLSVDGSTISGSGLFFDGGTEGSIDPFSTEGVAGTVEVSC